MFVKICGITNREDAWAAIEGGARALGFIFHPASPRYINPEALRTWIDSLPGEIWRVGVFVNRAPLEVEQVCRALSLDIVQLHGTESASEVPQSLRVWKAFRVATGIPDEARHFPTEALLLDGSASGKTFDWALARGLKQRLIVAGGLNEDNVAEAIETAQPWGVDACSSLEKSPGRKDHARLARFLKACQPALSIQT